MKKNSIFGIRKQSLDALRLNNQSEASQYNDPWDIYICARAVGRCVDESESQPLAMG